MHEKQANAHGGKDAPEYPGYKARECNGCGLCCLTVPCAIAAQFRLWKAGKCRALRFAAGRYWCDAIINPRRISVALAKHSKAERLDAMGGDTGCDHRSAYTEAAAFDLLAERNLADELAGVKYNSFPRACIYHRDDGSSCVITIEHPDEPPIMQECVDGLPYGKPKTLEPLHPAA